MSVIEDMRKVLQDSLAPELRTITARLDGIDTRLKIQDLRATDRHNERIARMDHLKVLFEFDKRLSKLEDRPGQQAS